MLICSCFFAVMEELDVSQMTEEHIEELWVD